MHRIEKHASIWHPIVLALCLGCASGSPPAESQLGPELRDGGVTFRYYDKDATRVSVVGDFNNWTVHADPLVDRNDDGQWLLFYPLRPGTYEYKFVIDGSRWIADPQNPNKAPDGFDGVNSVVTIPPAGASGG